MEHNHVDAVNDPFNFYIRLQIYNFFTFIIHIIATNSPFTPFIMLFLGYLCQIKYI